MTKENVRIIIKRNIHGMKLIIFSLLFRFFSLWLTKVMRINVFLLNRPSVSFQTTAVFLFAVAFQICGCSLTLSKFLFRLDAAMFSLPLF